MKINNRFNTQIVSSCEKILAALESFILESTVAIFHDKASRLYILNVV